MPGRRSFLIGCGCFVTAPALAKIGPPLAMSDLAPAEASTQAAIDLALRIEGWESPLDSQGLADDRPWIRINSSWRAAWR
jgi:hypothetical protein